MKKKTFKVGDKVKFNRKKLDYSVPFPAELGGFGPFVITEVRPAVYEGNGPQDIRIGESRWLNTWWFF